MAATPENTSTVATEEPCTDKCEICEEDNAASYCTECKTSLCTKCLKLHFKFPNSNYHSVVPVDQRESSASISSAQNTFCKHHANQTLNIVCEDCLSPICDECKPSHNCHNLLESDIDGNLLQKVSSRKIPGLMEILQKLKKHEDGTPEKIELYKTARELVTKWRDKILGIVNVDTGKLLDEIQSEIEKQEKVSENIATNAKKYIAKTDRYMVRLTDARNISDTTLLMANLSECDKEIEGAKSFLENIESNKETISLDDILPHRNELGTLEQVLHNFFTMNRPQVGSKRSASGNGKHQVIMCGKRSMSGRSTPNSCTSASIGKAPSSSASAPTLVAITSLGKGSGKGKGHASPKPGTSNIATTSRPDYTRLEEKADEYIGPSDGAYCISESAEPDSETVVLYNHGENDIFTFDIKKHSFKHFECNKSVYNMITLAQNKHVIIDYDSDNVYLTDGAFQTIATMPRAPDSDKYKRLGLCIKCDNTFVMSEYAEGDDATRFQEVNITNDNTFDMQVINRAEIEHWYGMITMDKTTGTVFVADTATSICKVKAGTEAPYHMDLSSYISNSIQSVHHDGSVCLIGDTYGNIHMVENDEHQGIVLKVSGTASGLAVRGGQLVVVSDNSVEVYG